MGVTKAKHENRLVWIVQIWPIFASQLVTYAGIVMLWVACDLLQFDAIQQASIVEFFVDHTHTASMNNLRWQLHWLPRLTSLPSKSRDWWWTRDSSLCQPTEEKKIKNQHFFLFFIFYFIKSQTSDSFVSYFKGHFAYLKTLDFSFNLKLFVSTKLHEIKQHWCYRTTHKPKKTNSCPCRGRAHCVNIAISGAIRILATSPFAKWLNTDSASYGSLVAAASLNTRSICKLRNKRTSWRYFGLYGDTPPPPPPINDLCAL